jgi:hypothetical protein
MCSGFPPETESRKRTTPRVTEDRSKNCASSNPWFRVPAEFLDWVFREYLEILAFNLFNNVHVINDVAQFDSHPRLQDLQCRIS